MGLNPEVPFDVPEVMERGFVVTQVDKLVNWARTGSLWPAIVAHMIVNVPAIYPVKVAILVACLAVLTIHWRDAWVFAREWAQYMKTNTRLVALLAALPIPALVVLAVSGKLPFDEIVYVACIALGIGSLLVRSTWSRRRQAGA